MGYGYGMGYGMFGGLWMIFWLIVLVVVILLIWKIFEKESGTTTGGYTRQTSSDAIRILDERLASGEITIEEYERLKDTLKK